MNGTRTGERRFSIIDADAFATLRYADAAR